MLHKIVYRRPKQTRKEVEIYIIKRYYYLSTHVIINHNKNIIEWRLPILGCCNFLQILASRSSFWKSRNRKIFFVKVLFITLLYSKVDKMKNKIKYGNITLDEIATKKNPLKWTRWQNNKIWWMNERWTIILYQLRVRISYFGEMNIHCGISKETSNKLRIVERAHLKTFLISLTSWYTMVPNEKQYFMSWSLLTFVIHS